MWKKLLAVTLTAGLGCLTPCVMGWTGISTESWTIVVDDLSEIERLEKELLLEMSAQSCATCHAAETIAIGPDSGRNEVGAIYWINENPGDVLDQYPQSATLYTAKMVKR